MQFCQDHRCKSSIPVCKGWTNEIHDIHILCSGMVYEDAEKLYAEIAKDGRQLLEEAFSILFPRSVSLSPMTAAAVPQGKLFAFNPTFFPRRDVVEVPLSGLGARLKGEMVQSSRDGKVGYALMDTQAGEGAGVVFARGLYADCHPPTGALLSFPLILSQVEADDEV